VAHLIIPMVAQMTAPSERGKVIGTLISGLILSLLLARSVSGTVGHLWGWRVMYWIGAGLMIAVAMVLYKRLPSNPPASKLRYRELMQSLVGLVREQPILRAAALNNALLFASFNAFWATLVFFLETPPYHYDSRAAGLFGLIGIVGAIASPIVGRLADRYGARLLIKVAINTTLAAFLILWTNGTHLFGLIVGVVLLDLGIHFAYLSNQVRVYNLVPNAESRLNTVYMVTNYTGAH
jgi:predicted MFS family arabinose efflux permease